MSNIGSFVKNSILFLLGSGLSKALAVLMLPLYTSMIPASDFGAYDISLVYITIISSFLYFELWVAVLRYMYDFDDQKRKFDVIKSGLIIFGLATFLFCIIGWVFCLLLDIRYPTLVIGYGIATAAATFMSFIARGYGKNLQFTISGVIATLVVIATNLLFLLVVKMDFSALYISYILGSLAQCVYLARSISFVSIIRDGAFDSRISQSILTFAIPLSLNTASYWVLSSASRLVYNYMEGDAASGLFSVGSKFAQVIVLATTCFNYAWQDISFSAVKGDDASGLYTRASEKYLIFLTAAFGIMLPLIKIVFPIFVVGEYTEAIDMVPMFLVVALVNGYTGFIGNVFYAIKQTKAVTVSSIVAGIVAVALSPLLITEFGANGANGAMLIGFIVNVAIRVASLNKHVGFRMRLIPTILCGVWITLSSLAYYFSSPIVLASFLISLVITVVVYRSDLSSLARKFKTTK